MNEEARILSRWTWLRRAGVLVGAAIGSSVIFLAVGDHSVGGVLSVIGVALLSAAATVGLCDVLVFRPIKRDYSCILSDTRSTRDMLEEAGKIGKIGWWKYDFEADRVEASEEVMRLFGLDAGSLPRSNKEFLNLLHPLDRDRVYETQRAALRDHGSYEVEYRLELPWGTRWFHQRARTEFLPSGWAISSFGTIQDITEARAAEAERAAFVGKVTHELRTPLTSISGSLALMREGALGELPPRAKSVCEIAHKNCRRLGKLVNDILDAEKLASGEMNIVRTRTDLTSVIEDAVQSSEHYASSLDVAIEVERPPEPVHVLCDRDRIVQVMNNLLSNAAKFSDAGATVRVRLSRVGGMARIDVIDRGAGIPVRAQSTVFDRFTQAHERTERTMNGTGLGLNIARAIIEAHEGTISFESQEGEGTTFSVMIPLSVTVVSNSDDAVAA